nr:transmembrane protein 205-like [Physcomitrium patens]|eukprot:XP_024396030.1 transmembrane protein 205-like [Physcomitrella patens]
MTFVSGMILSKHLPRQQFGYVQSQMFPVYLRIVAVGQIVLFYLHSVMQPWFWAGKIELMMLEQLQADKEDGRATDITLSSMEAKQLEDSKKKLIWINNRLKTLHGYSSALNLISLSGLTCHLWHLAHRLVV